MKEPTSPQPRAATPSGTSTPAAKPPDLMYNAANDEIHIRDRLAVVHRYRRIVVTVFVLASAAMMIRGYSNVQVFQARAQILIEDERSTVRASRRPTTPTTRIRSHYKTQLKPDGARPDAPGHRKAALKRSPNTTDRCGNDRSAVPERACLKPRPLHTGDDDRSAEIDETPDESALVSSSDTSPWFRSPAAASWTSPSTRATPVRRARRQHAG
jgi:hypothetical protein